MYQDRDGFMWFGTDRGVARFDGKSFRRYTVDDGLPAPLVYTIFQCGDRAMLFGMYQAGAARFDGTRINRLDSLSGVQGDNVFTIAQDENGRLWFSTETDIKVLDKSRVWRIPHSRPDSRKALFFPDGRCLYFDRDTLRLCRVTDGGVLHTTQIHAAPEVLLAIQAGFFAGPILRMNGEIVWEVQSGILRTRFVGDSLLESAGRIDFGARISVQAICEAPDSTLWVATRTGIIHCDRTGIMRYGRQEGIDPEYVQSIFVDREGTLWIGTLGGGVKKLLDEHVGWYTIADGLPSNNVTSLFVARNHAVWGGTNQSLFRIDPETRTVNITGGITEVRTFEEQKDGTLLVGSFHGLYSCSGVNAPDGRISTNGVGRDGAIASLLIDDEGALWEGTYGSGACYRKNGSTKTFSTADGIPSTMVESIAGGPSGIWLLSHDGGASLYRKGTFKRISTSEGLPTNDLFCVSEDSDGVVWFGSGKGLLRLQQGRITVFGNAEGLHGTTVVWLGRIPSDSALWVLTERALHRFFNGKFTLAGPSLVHLNPTTTLRHAALDRGKSLLWIASSEGVFSVNLGEIQNRTTAPQVAMLSFSADNHQIIESGSSAYGEKVSSPISLPSSQNDIELTFAGLSFIDEENTQFKYRLSGVQDDWSELTRETSIKIRNLPPGEYRFSVIAVNGHGVESSEPAMLAFSIAPPIWKRWWFVGLCILLLVAIVAVVVRRIDRRKYQKRIQELERERRILEERQRTRDQIARDLHDDLASTVGGAGLFIESVKRTAPDISDHARALLDKAGRLITEAEESMSDIVWSVSPRHDTLASLVARIREVSTDICRAHGIRFEAKIADVADGPSLDAEVRKTVYLIAKEALQNVVRHSGATAMTLHIALAESGILQLRLEDNGVGIGNPAEAERRGRSGGHGLINMRRRAEDIGARFSILPRREGGTVVELTVRMTQNGH
jgi:signal transduction histidine kinase